MVADSIRRCFCREEALHDKLAVIQIRKEKVLDLRHAECTCKQDDHGGSDYCLLVLHKERNKFSDKSVHRRIHHGSIFSSVILVMTRKPVLRADRHLNQSKHPAGKQAHAKHKEQIAGIFSRRIR